MTARPPAPRRTVTAPPAAAPDDAGMILVNVLAVIALASVAVLAMLALQQDAIGRSARFADAAQALAFVDGAEASVATALRRDGREAPQIDHLGEPWAQTAQVPVAIPGGALAVQIADANDRINVNALTGALGLARLRAIVAALDLGDDVAVRIAAAVRLGGPLSDLEGLAVAGVEPAQIARLATLLTALPGQGPVNLNTVQGDVLAVLLGNPAAAQALLARRAAQGFLSPDDVTQARVVLPPGLGFTSDLWWVQAQVRIGDVTQTRRSLLQRKRQRGDIAVAAIRRLRLAPPDTGG